MATKAEKQAQYDEAYERAYRAGHKVGSYPGQSEYQRQRALQDAEALEARAQEEKPYRPRHLTLHEVRAGHAGRAAGLRQGLKDAYGE